MASYDQLRERFDQIGPQHIQRYSPAWNDEFNHWVSSIMQEAGYASMEEMPFEIVDQFDYTPPAAPPGSMAGVQPGATVPLEQGLLATALPRLTTDMNNDVGRRTLANGLSSQAIAGAQGAASTLARTQGGSFDGRNYLAQNPDVAAEFARQRAAGQTTLGENEFAEKHYLEHGQREGRQPSYIQSAQAGQDQNNANRTTAANIAASNQAFSTNLGALQTATTAMQGNLTGALADRAGALAQQITSLTQNLDQLDATQRKALTDQIAAMQANLDQSIAAQRQALEQQVASLGTAATTEAQARRAALEQEIAGLTAAQAPLAEARMKAAELQATSVNVGLERTRDQLVAEGARDGYVGGSTVQDGTLARATVDARQRAAEAVGGARVANAGDTRDIAARGATGSRSIADALAAAQRDIAGVGATGNFQLSSGLARGRQGLGDASATGTAAITNQTATARAGIGALGANQTYQDRVMGANEKRSILDSLASGTANLTATNANQTLAANQQGNAQLSNYYDMNANRSIAGGLALATIPQNLTATLTGLDNYANSGLNRTLNTLNWWSGNQGAAPTPGATPVQPSNAGNDLSGLGAGLTSAAIGVGQANNWWRRPSSTNNSGANFTPSPTTGGPGN